MTRVALVVLVLWGCGDEPDDDRAGTVTVTCQTVAASVCQKACACRDGDFCTFAYGDPQFPATAGRRSEDCEAWVADLYGCGGPAPRISVSDCNREASTATCEDARLVLPEQCSPNFIEDCLASPSPSQACCDAGAC
jgi:hypothetical protein